MRYKGLPTWDGGKTTWGGQVEAMGTVLVCVCAQESWGEGMGVLVGKLDSPNDEEDTRSSHEYLNDLEEEYQARALLAKSKRFFKKVCSTPLLLLKKLDSDEPIFGPKTIKSILKLKSTFKAKTLKGITINEPSSAPARGKSSLASKTNLAPAVLFCKKCKRTNHRTCDHAEFMSSMNANQHHTGQGESSSRSRSSRPSASFPSGIHYGYNDHNSNDCLYYPTYEICRSYDHDTHGHNKIISLRRGLNPRNPQHVIKNCETCGSNVHTTSNHNDIEWFRKRETLQAKNDESFKASTNDSSSALRSKTPTKRLDTQVSLISMNEIKQILRNPTLLLLREFKFLILGLQYLSAAKKASLVDKVAMFLAETKDIAAAGCCANILWT
uniref:Uncharacterized protein n=1 Tax=Tanacetum cinerariifolium TaxID=118510 RepID=A0A6L2NWX3_TANCI|nr:hypothetical protein [Tanacetum cinerariifolium]